MKMVQVMNAGIYYAVKLVLKELAPEPNSRIKTNEQSGTKAETH